LDGKTPNNYAVQLNHWSVPLMSCGVFPARKGMPCADSDEFSSLYRNDFSHRSDLISAGARAILAGNIFLWHQGWPDVNLFELFFGAFFEGFHR
jgi:hypothetical protein